MNEVLGKARAAWRWAKGNIFVYILTLFLVSRLLYVGLGSVALRVFTPPDPQQVATFHTTISSHLPVQMWYNWDAQHYANLAREYSLSLSHLSPDAIQNGKNFYYFLHWFPLYSLVAKLLSMVTHISIPYCLLIISNGAFLVAMWLLYKLVRLDEDDRFARTVLALLILLPASFLFSAALSESLFLLLGVSTIYLARRQYWLWAGVCGGLMALTRSAGFLIAVPLAVEAVQQYGWPLALKGGRRTWWQRLKWRRKELRKFIRPALACLISVSGLLLFMLYSYLRTHNFLAYVDSEFVGSDVHIGNPLVYLVHNIFKLRTLIIFGELALVAAAWRKLRWSYLAYTAVFALAGLSVWAVTVSSSLRYLSVLFPMAIGAAYLVRKPNLGNFIWVALGITNGALFILWVCWWTQIII